MNRIKNNGIPKLFIILALTFLSVFLLVPNTVFADETGYTIADVVQEIYDMQARDGADKASKEDIKTVRQDVDGVKTDISNVKSSVERVQETVDSIKNIENVDKSITTKIFSLPEALLDATNKQWTHIAEALTLTNNGSKIPFGNFSFTINPSKYAFDEITDTFKIFGYSLVLVFFAVNLIEMTIKYEIFTLKGAVNIFGRLLLSKVVIDMSANICLYILNVFSSLNQEINFKAISNIAGNMPIINLETSKLWVIGPIIDAILAIIIIIPMYLIFSIILSTTCGVLVKLILRSFELSMLIAVSPAFFACYSSETTKPYFKNFILTFIQVAAQIVFMAVVYYIGADHITSQTTNINSFADLATWFTNTIPNALIIIAMSIMMIKPPKVLTNLIK